MMDYGMKLDLKNSFNFFFYRYSIQTILILFKFIQYNLEPLYLGTLLSLSLIGTFLFWVIYSSKDNEEQNHSYSLSNFNLNRGFNVSVINLDTYNNGSNILYHDNNAYYNYLLNSKPIDDNDDTPPKYEDVKMLNI
jgi:hypothetical protein